MSKARLAARAREQYGKRPGLSLKEEVHKV